MNIVWVSWKDESNPSSGGAERISGAFQRFLAETNNVTVITSSWKGGVDNEQLGDNLRILRVCRVWLMPFVVFFKYRQLNRKREVDLIIEEINTIPFFLGPVFRKKTIVLFYQLCKQVWFFQTKFPLSWFGYVFEVLYLRLYRKCRVLTESQSTKSELIRHGFDQHKIDVFPVFINPKKNLPAGRAYPGRYLFSCNSIRPMKRVADQVEAFRYLADVFQDLKLIIGGSCSRQHEKNLKALITRRGLASRVVLTGGLSERDKYWFYRDAEVLLVTSLKEGWGLTVTEANSVGTVAVAYDVDGLRDSIDHNKTGLLTDQSPKSLADAVSLFLFDSNMRDRLESGAIKWSREFTMENSTKKFREFLSQEIN